MFCEFRAELPRDRLSGLRVVPRSLVIRYKGLQADPATLGLVWGEQFRQKSTDLLTVQEEIA